MQFTASCGCPGLGRIYIWKEDVMYRFTILVGTCLALICGTAFAGDLRIDGTFASNATSGPPIEVNSSSVVPNLNADFLDGNDAAAFATKAEVDSVYNEVFFTADGTFTVPTDVTRLEVTVTGAGGGGGAGNTDAGGGGGGSGLVVTTVVTVTPGESLTADVGAGGVFGTLGGNGDPGQSSVLSDDLGTWRVEAAGGGRGFAPPFSGEGGDGGAGGLFGGGGGGGDALDGTGGSGIFVAGNDGFSGEGGAGASGGAGGLGLGGGGGGGGPGGGDGGDVAFNGDPGTHPGAGGGGGGASSDGGAGANGAILIRWVGAPEGS